MPTQNERFGRFVAGRLRLARRDGLKLLFEFLDDLAVAAAVKAFHEQRTIRLQMILREFERQIAQMLDAR